MLSTIAQKSNNLFSILKEMQTKDDDDLFKVIKQQSEDIAINQLEFEKTIAQTEKLKQKNHHKFDIFLKSADNIITSNDGLFKSVNDKFQKFLKEIQLFFDVESTDLKLDNLQELLNTDSLILKKSTKPNKIDSLDTKEDYCNLLEDIDSKPQLLHRKKGKAELDTFEKYLNDDATKIPLFNQPPIFQSMEYEENLDLNLDSHNPLLFRSPQNMSMKSSVCSQSSRNKVKTKSSVNMQMDQQDYTKKTLFGRINPNNDMKRNKSSKSTLQAEDTVYLADKKSPQTQPHLKYQILRSYNEYHTAQSQEKPVKGKALSMINCEVPIIKNHELSHIQANNIIDSHNIIHLGHIQSFKKHSMLRKNLQQQESLKNQQVAQNMGNLKNSINQLQAQSTHSLRESSVLSGSSNATSSKKFNFGSTRKMQERSLSNKNVQKEHRHHQADQSSTSNSKLNTQNDVYGVLKSNMMTRQMQQNLQRTEGQGMSRGLQSNFRQKIMMMNVSMGIQGNMQ